MKTTTSTALAALLLLGLAGCIKVEVPAKEADKPAAVASDTSAPAKDATSDDDAEAGRSHEDRGSPRDHGWGDGRSHAFDVCMDTGPAANGVQPAMLQCATDEESRQDDRLNQVYREVMDSLDGDRRDRLRDHQREWIHERDNKCARDETGGTNAVLEEHLCKTDMTIERRVHLEHRG